VAAVELRRRARLTRRELVASFLGAAVASACKRGERQAPVPGAVVDRAFETGHLLRSGPLPVSREPPRPLDVLVVGAGAAGLSAAWRLTAAGVGDLRVCELDDAPGGTARSGHNAISAFPWGAHYLPAPLTAQGPVPRLLRELGALTSVDDQGRPRFAEEMRVRDPEERLFYRGAWYEGLYLRAGASPQDLAELARFEEQMDALSAARDAKGRKAFAVPTALGSEDAEWTRLDRLSMADWLRAQGYRSERLWWMVQYACRDDYGAAAEHVSAWAGLWYFCARQDGKHHRGEGYLSWPEGNGRLIRHLAEAVGAPRLCPSVLVHTLTPGRDGVRVDALEAGTRRPLAFQARQVVFAGPRFVAARVVEPWRRAPPAFLAEFQYGPWVVANLSLAEPPESRGFPLAWDNVLYESQSLGYVVATHQRDVALERGPTVFTWYYPLAGADVHAERSRALSLRYEDWEALVMADLVPAHFGLRALSTRLEVMRWGHAMVRPRPGFLWGGARQAAAESLGGHLHFAHTDLGGLPLFEEANFFGVRAAERALEGLGRAFESWL
jgi:hypothetical protein